MHAIVKIQLYVRIYAKWNLDALNMEPMCTYSNNWHSSLCDTRSYVLAIGEVLCIKVTIVNIEWYLFFNTIKLCIQHDKIEILVEYFNSYFFKQ